MFIFSPEFIAHVAAALEKSEDEIIEAFTSFSAAKSKAPKTKSKAAPKSKKAPVEESGDEGEPDLTKMTVAQLKVLCGERDLKTSGSKAVLIARLNGEESDAETEAPKKGKSTKKAPAKGKAAKKGKAKKEESDAEDEGASKDYAKMTVAELKELLTERGLPKTGKKEDFVERLREADGKGAADGEEEPEVEEEADADEE